jgi:hypothetical protein
LAVGQRFPIHSRTSTPDDRLAVGILWPFAASFCHNGNRGFGREFTCKRQIPFPLMPSGARPAQLPPLSGLFLLEQLSLRRVLQAQFWLLAGDRMREYAIATILFVTTHVVIRRIRLWLSHMPRHQIVYPGH